jgi:hypothetical protein
MYSNKGIITQQHETEHKCVVDFCAPTWEDLHPLPGKFVPQHRTASPESIQQQGISDPLLVLSLAHSFD